MSNQTKLSEEAIKAIEEILASGDSANVVVEDGVVIVYSIESTPIFIEG